MKLVAVCFLAITCANAQTSLFRLRLEDDAGGWLSGAIGYQTNGADFSKRFSEQLHWEYRTKDAFGVVIGMQLWKSRTGDKYEGWLALDAGMKLRFPLGGITPQFGFGTKLVAGWGIGTLYYYSLGFELPVVRWLHPTMWIMRTSARQDSFFFFAGVVLKL